MIPLRPECPLLPDIIQMMLPATFQTPAALVLLCGGLLACFAGYRVFRVVLAIYGFILGVLLASSFMGTEQTLWMILIWLGAGLAGALILMVAYFAGVALLGALIAALVADAIWASFGSEPGILSVILFSVGGALAALALQRYVVIVSTSFGGAQTALVGAAALLGDARAAQAATRAVFNVYPLNPLPNTYWDLGIALALGLAGVIVQLGVTAKGRK
jgi:Domain of unknown function (DUF4203)